MRFNSAMIQGAVQNHGLNAKDPAALMASKAKAQSDPEAIAEVAKQFESIFMHQVFKSMRQTLPKDGMMSGGFGEDVFTDMLDQEYAGMATQNQSMGLAAVIAEQLGGNQSGLESGLAPKALRQLKASQAYALENTSGQWQEPSAGAVSKSFGMTRAMNASRAHFHGGLDFQVESSTPVSATRSGFVSRIESLGPNRNRVEIDHGDGFVSSYEGISDVAHSVGAIIKQGDQLGTAAAPSQGEHQGFHFEIRHKGRAIDPRPLLASE